MKKGLVFNIQRYCLDDGDGIRTTVFFKGCPLRCVWCHNPESWRKYAQILYDSRKCIGCGLCISACERDCHLLGNVHSYNRENCDLCGNCADICPSKAIELCGKEMTADEITEIIKRDIIYYKNGGGATLSGGEPLMQAEFAIELAKKISDNGISVNIETSGYGKAEDFEKLLPYCDRFLFDIKASAEDYQKYTGVKYDTIHSNLILLKTLSAKVTLRCPIIPGCNDNTTFAEHICSAVKDSGADSVHLMPYHSSGVGKCILLDIKKQPVFETPNKEILENIADIIKENTKINVIIK